MNPVTVLMLIMQGLVVLIIAWIATSIHELAGNTNHIMDQLVKVTGESEYAKGVRASGEAHAAAAAAAAAQPISVILGPGEKK